MGDHTKRSEEFVSKIAGLLGRLGQVHQGSGPQLTNEELESLDDILSNNTTDNPCIVKAGDKQPHSGHHHLLIDTDLPDPGLPVPADAHHVHFGDGSTTTEITLAAGEHTLQLLLGDHLHIPHDPPVVSNPITITVK